VFVVVPCFLLSWRFSLTGPGSTFFPPAIGRFSATTFVERLNQVCLCPDPPVDANALFIRHLQFQMLPKLEALHSHNIDSICGRLRDRQRFQEPTGKNLHRQPGGIDYPQNTAGQLLSTDPICYIPLPMPHIAKHPPGAFCWIELTTTDLSAAKRFYGSLFGWTATDFPMGPNDFYSIFQLEGRDAAAAYTMRPEQRSQGVPPHWAIYVSVENADETANRAALLGGKVLAPAFDVYDMGRMAVVQDPTGAIFSVWQPKRHQGTGISGNAGTLCWADLSTPDPARAKEFYSSLFGWRITPGENDTSGYWHIMNGEDFIGGIPPTTYRDPKVPPHWLSYFLVSNCDATANKAKELGAQYHLAPMTLERVGRFAVLADPQGAVFAVFQNLPHA